MNNIYKLLFFVCFKYIYTVYFLIHHPFVHPLYTLHCLSKINTRRENHQRGCSLLLQFYIYLFVSQRFLLSIRKSRLIDSIFFCFFLLYFICFDLKLLRDTFFFFLYSCTMFAKGCLSKKRERKVRAQEQRESETTSTTIEKKYVS